VSAWWAFTARFAQHLSSIFLEFAAIGAYQRLCLEEYDH
jgi:chromosome segregation ATPase